MAVASNDILKEDSEYVMNDLSTGGKIFGTPLGNGFTLDQWKEAIKDAEVNSTAGKIHLKPNN